MATVLGLSAGAAYAALGRITGEAVVPRARAQTAQTPKRGGNLRVSMNVKEISDPALYRSKESLQKIMECDPILILKGALISEGFLTEADFKELDAAQKEIVIAAMKFAEESPWPDPMTLEEGVFAPEE